MAHDKYRWDPKSIVAIRKHLKMTQGELSRWVGVHPDTISRWENNVSIPSVYYLAQLYTIAKANGFDPEFFNIVAMVSDASNV